MASPQATLLGLPRELHAIIFEHLEYRSAIMLSRTCFYFHRTLDPVKVVNDTVKEIELDYLEFVPQHADDKGFACFKCWKIKPRDAFAKKQVTAKRGKGHDDAERRFCSDCGTSKGFYLRGNQVRMTDGTLYWKCVRCTELKDGLYCTYCTLCQDCLRLPAGFKGHQCRLCHLTRIAGEPRPRPIPQGYPTYVSLMITPL